MGNRVLGAVRQSRTKTKVKGKAADPMSAPAQKRAIKKWADANDGEVVKLVEDLSTSGKVSAFKRKELGPWLTDPEKIKTWDILVVTKLDRACRNLRDFLQLDAWCTRNGKRLVIINDPSLNTSTPQGKAMASVRATFAELERDLAVIRNTERYEEMIEQGKWPGGRLPYGWKHDEDSGKLVPDDGGRADVLRQMADKSIAGKSDGLIAEWLNAEGYTTVIGRAWKQDTVRRVLRHEKTQALLGEAKSAELRAARRSREQNRGERVGGHMLLRIAFCRTCQSPLYVHRRKDRRPQIRCLPCGWYIRLGPLEEFVESRLLKAVGDRKLRERVLVPGDDHQAQIHRLEGEIETLARVTGTQGLIETKRAEIAALKAEPFEPDHYALREIPGFTVRQYWAALDREGRGTFMRSWGVRVEADKTGAELTLGWLDADDTETFPVS
jgi:site-specific DNA recombinase